MKAVIMKPGSYIIFDTLWVVARNTRHRIRNIRLSRYRKNETDEIKPVENHELFDHLFIQ